MTTEQTAPARDLPTLDDLLATVAPAAAAAAGAAAERHDQLAKPPGSLGRLEVLGARLSAIAGRCPPPVPIDPVVVVAAGDHGVHAQGVSDWPQAVTGAMVTTVAGGRAGINAIARTVGAQVVVVDIGTACGGGDETAPDVDLIRARIRCGTRDLSQEPALTREECEAAIATGAAVTARLVDEGADLVALGDLGIGNTTASACLVAAFTGAPADAVTGNGANKDATRLAHKIDTVAAALRRHGDDRDPLGVLASLGGLEHAALAGAMLSGAARRVPVVLDGIIADAAALAAVALAPAAANYLVAGHASTEPGAGHALRVLELEPLLDLRLRLGEGTGAALAIPIVQAAARVLSDMALLTDLG